MNDKKQSFEETYDVYRRIYPVYRGPHKWRRFFGWLGTSDLKIAILVFVVVLSVVVTLDVLLGFDYKGVLVESHGLLMDIFVFGCLFLWFNERRSHRERIRTYQETLVDLADWGEREGVLKKVALVKRLEDIAGVNKIPALDYSQLPGANFQGVNLQGTCFSFTNLHCAFLNGTYLKNANLAGAQLTDACLHSAVLEGADLRGANLVGAEFTYAKLSGVKLGKYFVGQAVPGRQTGHVTDLRGTVGLTEEQLMSTSGWENAIRDPHLACGKPIPEVGQ